MKLSKRREITQLRVAQGPVPQALAPVVGMRGSPPTPSTSASSNLRSKAISAQPGAREHRIKVMGDSRTYQHFLTMLMT